jgi:photosystem II stability/assembly factor-like uncharacterized protein
MNKVLFLVIVAIFTISTSCKKEEIISKSETVVSKSDQLSQNKVNNKPETTVITNDVKTLSDNIWGIGGQNRIYKYNGSYWTEPNPACGLVQISAVSNSVAWGVGSGGHIYKTITGGNSWTEPNPACGLVQISAVSNSVAWGVGSGGNVYKTITGGNNWSEPNPTCRLKQISVGVGDNLWGITQYDEVMRYVNGTWVQIPNYRFSQISAANNTSIAWAIGSGNTNIYRTRIYYGIEYPNYFDQPNPNAGLYQISAGDYGTAWGIGSAGHIYKSTDNGASWSEPNPSATLLQISVGKE